MNTLTLFIIEVLLSFSISATVVILIKPLLRDVLVKPVEHKSELSSG